MMTRKTCRSTAVCLGTLLGVFLLALGAAAQDGDAGWPREIDAPEGTIVIYQPQVESFEGDELQARMAVSVTLKGRIEPVFGAAWVEARVLTDRDTRTVSVLDAKVLRAKFPNSTAEQEKKFAEIVEEAVPKWDLTISLDRLLTSLQTLEKERAASESMQNTPPKILHVTYPAVLVTIDGEPQLRPVEDSKVMRVVNTPYLIVFEPDTKAYYLSGSDVWYAAKEVRGPWEVSLDIPAGVEALAPPSSGEPSSSAGQPSDAGRPRIIVTTEPKELIVTEGNPAYSPLGTDLLYISNTESDIVMEIATQEHYLLLSGRWYKSKSLDGPWAYVSSEDLPSGFADIPPESAKGDVLTHVAGTQQAEDAVMDAQIPQTAAVKRSEATLEVTYDGEPKFELIEGTSMYYAVNTGTQVLRMQGKYYACDQGVWFVSKHSTGPWVVADSIPADVQEIPPSSPVYNVKYVYIYDSTPDVVYVGYTPGYVGCYPYGGVVVYGTGYYYNP